MAGNFLNADISQPDLSRYKTTEQKLAAMENYLFLLLENLRYAMRNLSPENFNIKEMEDWVSTLKAGTVITQTLISNTVVTDLLYASYGDIADLTVNRLSTSRRILKYLGRDLSDDDYILIQGETIEFRKGQTDGTVIQATLPDGRPIYWEKDISEATLGDTGYPEIDGERVLTTVKATQWPAYAYKYTENVNRAISFGMVEDNYGVIDTFGAGDGAGGNQGWMVKTTKDLRVIFRTSNQKDIGMVMGNDGYTDVYGMRRPVFLDFSELPLGRFYETVEGIDKEYGYSVENDEQGRPIKITDDETGFVTEVKWWDE